jgi:zeaxanthin glucosyltransferase
MRHFGLVCPPASGHMHPMLALGREIVRRGHRATVVAHPDVQQKVEFAGLEFHPVGATEIPPGTLNELLSRLSGLTGSEALVQIVEMGIPMTAAYVRELPDVIRGRGFDAMLIDEIASPAGAVAYSLGTPFVTVCGALPTIRDLGIPPCGSNLTYRAGWAGRLRNLVAGVQVAWPVRRPVMKSLRAVKPLGARIAWRPWKWHSRLATITQLPEEFDFPHRPQNTFHYAGPFIDPGLRIPSEFPFEKLDGRPMIFASLGTLAGSPEWFRCIAAACAQIDAQLVLALGGGDPAQLGELPGSPIVVPYAPQLELLKRATLMISHAGLNSVLEALACGVPLVAIPLTSDQPGVAARLEWHGAGERILPEQLSVERLRAAVQRVLTEPSYREQARRLQRAIQSSGGARRAADIVESALARRDPRAPSAARSR